MSYKSGFQPSAEAYPRTRLISSRLNRRTVNSARVLIVILPPSKPNT
jgi:hypothetical protein